MKLPIELIDMILAYLEPFERFRLGLLTKTAPNQTIYLSFQTDRHWRMEMIKFRWSKGYALIRYRPYTYTDLIAWLERAVHRAMNMTPHPYNLRRPKRTSTAQWFTKQTRTHSSGQVVTYERRPRCERPFTHAVYVKATPLGPAVAIARAEDTTAVLTTLFK